MRDPLLSRRALGRLLASSALGLLAARPGFGAGEGPRDQGIGGTGVRPTSDEEGDRGIGGTGVVGTIRRFGSIVVNGLRIAYPRDAVVLVDDAPARAEDLRLGQVVRVVARGGAGALSTRRIEVASEVVGPIERVGVGEIAVAGQTVSLARLGGRTERGLGERVAVSGLRRGDGTIVASRVDPRAAGAVRVSGPVRLGAQGHPMIGALRLVGLDPALVGARARVVGTLGDEGLAVSEARAERALFRPELRRLSVEAYVERSDAGLRLGSGLALPGARGVPREGEVRAVLTSEVGPAGRLRVESVRVEERGDGARQGRPDGGRGERGGPGQRAPDGAGADGTGPVATAPARAAPSAARAAAEGWAREAGARAARVGSRANRLSVAAPVWIAGPAQAGGPAAWRSTRARPAATAAGSAARGRASSAGRAASAPGGTAAREVPAGRALPDQASAAGSAGRAAEARADRRPRSTVGGRRPPRGG